MRRLLCWIEANYKFHRFLNRNAYLKTTIKKDEIKECVNRLAQNIYKRYYGDKKC